MERAAREPRIEHPAEDGAVAVEVPTKKRAHASDGAVAAFLVEEIVDQAAQCAVYAEELLQRPRQRAVLGGKRVAKSEFERSGGTIVGLVRPMHKPFELAGDEVDVERHSRIAQRDEADLQPALHDGGSIHLGMVAHVLRQFGVVQQETRDGDVVALDANIATEGDGLYLPDHRFSSLRTPPRISRGERVEARRHMPVATHVGRSNRLTARGNP